MTCIARLKGELKPGFNGPGTAENNRKGKNRCEVLRQERNTGCNKLQEHTCLMTPTGRSHSAAAVGGDYHFLLGRLIPGPLNRDMSPLERKQKHLALELATKPCPPLPLSVWILSPSEESFSVFSCPLPKKAELHCNTDYLQQGSDHLPPATPGSVVSGPSSAFMNSSLPRPHCPSQAPCLVWPSLPGVQPPPPRMPDKPWFSRSASMTCLHHV